MIICIANEKGGSGKSNIAINLAIKLHSLKEDVLLIDSDPQNSIKTFSNIRANKEVPFGFNDDLTLCDSVLYEREIYRNSFANGMGVVEFAKRNDNALKDFESFFNELVAFAKDKKENKVKKTKKGA